MEHLRERLSRLLLLLLGTLESQRDGLALEPEEVMKLLAGAGYGEQDLQDLWNWLHGRWTPTGQQPAWLSSQLGARASQEALRLMGAREDEVVTVPAFGYLLELVRTDQITAEQMESLLQFAQLVPGQPMTPGEISGLLERVVVSERDGWSSGAAGWSDRAH
jgi:uncharacterized protein Smg (DUF494 family)